MRRPIRLDDVLLGFGLVGVGVAIGGLLVTRLDKTWLEAIATAAAAVAAAWAAVSATRIATKDRQASAKQADSDRRVSLQMWRAEQAESRYRDAQELLIAFEEYVGARRVGMTAEVDEEKYRGPAATFVGRLRASTEELPLSRKSMFSHIPPGEEDVEAAIGRYSGKFESLGNPEVESFQVIAIRGELLSSITSRLHELADLRTLIESMAPKPVLGSQVVLPKSLSDKEEKQ